jgi:DNA-binding Lrp family transcriptional regulator
MSDDVYLKLREFMDRLPGGFPETETGVELRILRWLYKPEEAEMMLQLNPYPEPVGAIAARVGMDEAATAELLESMAKRGNIFRIRVNGDPFYMAMSFLVGVYEFHLKSIDKEFADMMHEYESYVTNAWEPIQTKQLRVVPIGTALEADHDVATYDNVRDMVKSYDKIAVADCVCRVERGVLGHKCDRTLETCIVLGFGADYYVENGMARYISQEECAALFDKAEDEALVVCPSNSKDLVNI